MKVTHTASGVQYTVVRKNGLGSSHMYVLLNEATGERKMVNWSAKSSEYTVDEE